MKQQKIFEEFVRQNRHSSSSSSSSSHHHPPPHSHSHSRPYTSTQPNHSVALGPEFRIHAAKTTGGRATYPISSPQGNSFVNVTNNTYTLTNVHEIATSKATVILNEEKSQHIEITTNSGRRMGTMKVVHQDVSAFFPSFLKRLSRNMFSTVFLYDQDDKVIGMGTIWRALFAKRIKISDAKYGIISTMKSSLFSRYWQCRTTGPVVVLDPAFLVYLVTHENKSPPTYFFITFFLFS